MTTTFARSLERRAAEVGNATMLRRDPLANPEPLIRRVYAYAAYRLGAGPDAEDVTSETFARALRYRESFDPQKGEPVAWLLGIARRCADETLSAVRPLLTETEDAPAPGDLQEEAERRLLLKSALEQLGERDRELVALRYGADLSARQIGEVLGIRTNAVEVALHRALGRMRAHLDPAEVKKRDEGVRLRRPQPYSFQKHAPATSSDE